MKNKIENSLEDNNFRERLSEVLENDKVTIRMFADGNEVTIKDITIENSSKLTDSYSKHLKTQVNKVEKKSIIEKLGSAMKKGIETTIDSFAKNFLKKKYKLNYSVYNDGKKALIAIKNRDAPTFLKKISDSALYTIKAIPSETKKVIKNTKNTIIDEFFE